MKLVGQRTADTGENVVYVPSLARGGSQLATRNTVCCTRARVYSRYKSICHSRLAHTRVSITSTTHACNYGDSPNPPVGVLYALRKALKTQRTHRLGRAGVNVFLRGR